MREAARLRVTHTAHELGAKVVAVQHASIARDAAGLPGPATLWHLLLRAWTHHACDEPDAVMAVVEPRADRGRAAPIALRFGLHPAFVPQPDVRQDHVLYVGRLAPEKGVVALLHAAARSHEPWQLKLVGDGPGERRLRGLAMRLGIGAAALGSRSPADHQPCRRSRDVRRSARAIAGRAGIGSTRRCTTPIHKSLRRKDAAASPQIIATHSAAHPGRRAAVRPRRQPGRGRSGRRYSWSSSS